MEGRAQFPKRQQFDIYILNQHVKNLCFDPQPISPELSSATSIRPFAKRVGVDKTTHYIKLDLRQTFLLTD